MPSFSQRLVVRFVLPLLVALETRAAAAQLFSDWPSPSELQGTVGEQQVVISEKQMPWCPAAAISVVPTAPLTFLLPAGGETFSLTGLGFNARPGVKVQLDGKSFPELTTCYFDKSKGVCLAFYSSANELKILNSENPGKYHAIHVAAGTADARSFRSLGPILRADRPFEHPAPNAGIETLPAYWWQGVRVHGVVPTPDGKNLLCYYGDWSHWRERGPQLHVAQCAVERAAEPAAWLKYHNSSFSEPGIGGHESPIISAYPQGDIRFAQVQYVRPWNRYLIVLQVFTHGDQQSGIATETGFYLSTSRDGIAWSRPLQIDKTLVHPRDRSAHRWNPTLLIDQLKGNQATGRLLFGYTPRTPDTPFHLCAKPVRITFSEQPGTATFSVPTPPVTSTTASTAGPQEPWGAELILTFDDLDGKTLRPTTIVDSSGNGRDGQAQGVAITAGKVGKGLLFDQQDLVEIAGPLPAGGASRTLAFWCRSAEAGARRVEILAYGGVNPDTGFGFAQVDGKWRFIEFAGGLDSGMAVDAGWHHHCTTYDGRDLTYYIDGRATAKTTRNLKTVKKPLLLGAGPSRSEKSHFEGILDELVLYNRSLSSNEVEQLYQLGLKQQHPPK